MDRGAAMTGHEMLKKAREVAYYYEKNGKPGVATTIFDLINEIERLREAAKGSAVIVNQASRDLKHARGEMVLATLHIAKLRTHLRSVVDHMLDMVEADMGREIRPGEMPKVWRKADEFLDDTAKPWGDRQ